MTQLVQGAWKSLVVVSLLVACSDGDDTGSGTQGAMSTGGFQPTPSATVQMTGPLQTMTPTPVVQPMPTQPATAQPPVTPQPLMPQPVMPQPTAVETAPVQTPAPLTPAVPTEEMPDTEAGGAGGMGGMGGDPPEEMGGAGGSGGTPAETGGAGGGGEEPGVTFDQVYPILTSNCSGMMCHGDGATNNHPEFASSNPATAEAEMTARAMDVLDRITRMPNEMGFMPRMRPMPLSEDEISTISAWVETL